MVVQWLGEVVVGPYGRHHVAVQSTIASCGSEGMIWPPTDSRRTLADDGTVRRLCWRVRLLRCEARVDVVLLHGAAPRCKTVAGAGGK